ncbi:type IV pilus assembly PilZ [Solidesulfovibrio fructosivorans JJ]]|uniref:Type IV pilus assembly PilZ n=1 Tax=Solidesulfovibrio fructosivorans JJ] TaxID=596151 RepID=E1JVB6_SOLFR|nr:PilZ domain-containing protein [Solidesulfovibrio fructosivorans]EFL51710.1 type IV pilus assembly PilZ [Solidesulfovibrio fructosivorans JJ]]
MVLDMLRKKKSPREEEQEHRRNAGILDEAMAQRSKVHVKFDQQATSLTGVTASIMAMNDAGLVLELSGLSTLKERFVGQRIECFFKIVEREQRHREIFYTFATTILRIRNQSEKLPQIAVSFPGSLQGAQRRKSLRMKPSMDQFTHIALWRYDAAGGFDLAKPTVSHGHFKNSLALLENISAGGLRLLLRRDLLKEKGLSPQKGDRFILFFTFEENSPKLRGEYWLVGKINNIRPDPVSHDITLGVEFVANGVRQAESGKVEWNKIMDNVIDDMAQRIYEWHLALYRDKGLNG